MLACSRSLRRTAEPVVPGWTPTEAPVSDLQNLSRPFVIGISIQIGLGVSNMFPEIHFSCQFPKLCIKVQEGKGGIWMQNFLLYFLCRYGNVSQVPESQDRLAGFRIFPRFEGNSWGQDKWSGPYLPAGLSTDIITIIITGRLLGGKSSHSGDHKTYFEDFRICIDVLL